MGNSVGLRSQFASGGCGLEIVLPHWTTRKFYPSFALEHVGIILAQTAKNPALSKKDIRICCYAIQTKENK